MTKHNKHVRAPALFRNKQTVGHVALSLVKKEGKKAVKYDSDGRDLDNLFLIWVTAESCRCLLSTNTQRALLQDQTPTKFKFAIKYSIVLN